MSIEIERFVMSSSNVDAYNLIIKLQNDKGYIQTLSMHGMPELPQLDDSKNTYDIAIAIEYELRKGMQSPFFRQAH